MRGLVMKMRGEIQGGEIISQPHTQLKIPSHVDTELMSLKKKQETQRKTEKTDTSLMMTYRW